MIAPNCGLWEQWDTRMEDKTGWHSGDNMFKYIFLAANVCNLPEILLKFIAENPTDFEMALVQVMASDWPGDI